MTMGIHGAMGQPEQATRLRWWSAVMVVEEMVVLPAGREHEVALVGVVRTARKKKSLLLPVKNCPLLSVTAAVVVHPVGTTSDMEVIWRAVQANQGL